LALLDASGSMSVYSRYFLYFVRGLIGRWLHADAFDCFAPARSLASLAALEDELARL
jgi:uncharacterized protein with von Willebrand factor type A (vWA) domain